MRKITVYRVDYVRKLKVPIGWVKERRKKDRADNLFGLLRMARKKFALSPEDALHIAVDIKEASEPGNGTARGAAVASGHVAHVSTEGR